MTNIGFFKRITGWFFLNIFNNAKSRGNIQKRERESFEKNMSAAQCVDTVPKVECTKLLLIRHNEGPCDRLTPDEKDLCAKTCMKCRGPDCKDEVKFCDTEFIPIHYNCDILRKVLISILH